MPDILWDAWNSAGFRYVGATLVGFLVAFGVEWLGSYLERRRLRSAVREALVEEVTDNLDTLYRISDCFRENRGGNAPQWPIARFRTAMLERCLDSSVIAVLTRQEQIQAAIGYYQSMQVNDQLDKGREEFVRLQQNPLPFASRMRRIEWYLPIIGQTFMNLLLKVLEEQQEFASTRSASMAQKLIPLFEANDFDAIRTWRTAQLPESERVRRYIVVWRNDSPEAVPAGVQVIELAPPPGPYGTMKLGDERRFRGPWRYLKRRSRLRRLRRSAKQLAGTQVLHESGKPAASDASQAGEPLAS